MFGLGNKNKAKEQHFSGKEETWLWRGHRVVFSVLGTGAPLILQHSINAAAWGIDWRSNAETLAEHYRVYVPDLPGFGRSERKAIKYTAELYIDFHADFARYVVEREGQAPAIIAASLSAAHVLGAVAQTPESFGPLMLLVPTGLEKLNSPQTPKAAKVYRWLAGPLGSAVYWLLTTRRITRRFLASDGYYNPQAIDTELVDTYNRSSRQPNAKYAPIAFLTFALNYDVKQVWPNIEQPVLLAWGRHASRTPVANADAFLSLRPNTDFYIFEDGKLAIYDENAAEFNSLALTWLKQHFDDKGAQVGAGYRSSGLTRS